MVFYFFRHGETEWNHLRRFQGSTDIPLNAKGREQAIELSKKFSNIKIDAIISSDLGRAKETAQLALSHLNLEVEYSPNLQEANLGQVEGMYRTEFDKLYGPDFWEKWKSVDEELLDYSFPESETPRQHLQRVKDFLENWVKDKAYESVAVSTHGGVIWRIIHFCDPNPHLPPTIFNCSLYKISLVEGQWKYEGEL